MDVTLNCLLRIFFVCMLRHLRRNFACICMFFFGNDMICPKQKNARGTVNSGRLCNLLFPARKLGICAMLWCCVVVLDHVGDVLPPFFKTFLIFIRFCNTLSLLILSSHISSVHRSGLSPLDGNIFGKHKPKLPDMLQYFCYSYGSL